MDLDILERQVPVTQENPEKSKKGLYRIKDNFIKFWFQFVYPYKSFIETGNVDFVDFVMNKIKADLASRHISYVYGDICREKMWQLNQEERLPFFVDRVGRWWNSSQEIDIVAYESTGRDMIFGECKYTNELMDTGIFYALQKKKGAVAWKKDRRREHFIFFSINVYTEQV